MGKSETYERRINIYINGQVVNNDIASIRKEMFKLTNELARTTRGTDEYNKKAAELRRIKSILKEHQDAISANKSAWDRSKSAVTGFIGKFAGIAGAAVGAWKGIKSIIDSTEGLSDRWSKMVGGVKEFFFEFKHAIGSVDFRSFFDGLGEAFERGKHLAEEMDALADRRAYSDYKIAQWDRESKKLQETTKNREIDITKRHEAAKQREEIELRIQARTVDLAQRTFQIEKETWEGRNKMAVEEALKLYEAIDNMDIAQRQRMEKSWNLFNLEYSPEKAAEMIKNFAPRDGYENISAESRKQFTDYMLLLEKGEGEVLPKLFNAFKNIEAATAQAQERFNAVVRESSGIGVKAGREGGIDVPDDVSSIVEQTMQAGMTLTEFMDSQDEQFRKKQTDRLVEWSKTVTDQTEIQIQVQKGAIEEIEEARKKAFEEEKRDYEDKLLMAMDYASAVGSVLGQAVADGEMTAKEAAKQILLIAIDALRSYAKIAITQATIGSLTSADSIATFGASGIAKAAILTALIEAALAGVETVIKNKMYTGGHTGWGGKYEPAGVVHKREWVANAEMVASPVTGPIIQALEQIRTGTAGYEAGGGVSSGPASAAAAPASLSLTTDPELKLIMKGVVRLLAKIDKEGVRTDFGYREADGVRKVMDKLTALEEGVSL